MLCFCLFTLLHLFLTLNSADFVGGVQISFARQRKVPSYATDSGRVM